MPEFPVQQKKLKILGYNRGLKKNHKLFRETIDVWKIKCGDFIKWLAPLCGANATISYNFFTEDSNAAINNNNNKEDIPAFSFATYCTMLGY